MQQQIDFDTQIRPGRMEYRDLMWSARSQLLDDVLNVSLDFDLSNINVIRVF